MTLLGCSAASSPAANTTRECSTSSVIEPIEGPEYAAEDLYPDALPCLAELKARSYRLGLAGNQPARTEHFLRTLGVDVDLVASSATWGVEKPSPGFFERLAAELALEPFEIAYVGDRVDNDVVAVKAAGMVAVHIRRGPWGFLHDASAADIHVRTLTDLPEMLAALARPTSPSSVSPYRACAEQSRLEGAARDGLP